MSKTWVKINILLKISSCYVRRCWIKNSFCFTKVWNTNISYELLMIFHKKNWNYMFNKIYCNNIPIQIMCNLSQISFEGSRKEKNQCCDADIVDKLQQIMKMVKTNKIEHSLRVCLNILRVLQGRLKIDIFTPINKIIFMFPIIISSETDHQTTHHNFYYIKNHYQPQDVKNIINIFDQLNNVNDHVVKQNIIKLYKPKHLDDVIESYVFWKQNNLDNFKQQIIKNYYTTLYKNIIWTNNDENFKKLKLFLSTHNIILTDSQQQVVWNIVEHIAQKQCIHGLVLGDVGSGKSIIMLSIIYFSIQNATNIIISTPNLILTQQFSDFLCCFFSQDIILNTNFIPKHDLYKHMGANIKIIVGTLSILKSKLPENYKLLLIDEEQKIGVEMKEKHMYSGLSTIFFTATPSPRTMVLSMNNYRKLFVLLPRYQYLTYIKHTIIDLDSSEEELINKIISNIKNHKKTILLTTHILNGKWSVEDLIKWCTDQIHIKRENILDINGRKNNIDNMKILNMFRHSKQHYLLISTNIIANGLNLKELDTIIVFNVKYFGLLQLHQIRGRLGRFKQYNNFILCHSNIKNINKITFLVDNKDFLKIIEFDLKTRGFGNLIKTKQTGKSKFQLFSQSDLINIIFTEFRDRILKKNRILLNKINENK